MKIETKFSRTGCPMLMQNDMQSNSMGADLRALRKARGLTLAALGGLLSRSVGWISQVERDLSRPSIDDLRSFATAFDVPVSLFFGQSTAPQDELGYVVRKAARRKIGSGVAGLVEEMLSPDLTDDFEVVHSVFQPNAQLSTPNARPTQEVAYLISGKLDLTIGGREFTLLPGDSFRIRGETYSWANPYPQPAIAIWVIAPPVY